MEADILSRCLDLTSAFKYSKICFDMKLKLEKSFKAEVVAITKVIQGVQPRKKHHKDQESDKNSFEKNKLDKLKITDKL